MGDPARVGSQNVGLLPEVFLTRLPPSPVKFLRTFPPPPSLPTCVTFPVYDVPRPAPARRADGLSRGHDPRGEGGPQTVAERRRQEDGRRGARAGTPVAAHALHRQATARSRRQRDSAFLRERRAGEDARAPAARRPLP